MANQYIRDLTPWPLGTPLPADGLYIFYDPNTDEEYRLLPEQLGGANTGETRDPDAVPAAKRTEVADAIIAAVQGGGQAYLLEPDPQFYRCEFVDNRTDDERMVYVCRKQANFSTGATEFCWYRHVVE